MKWPARQKAWRLPAELFAEWASGPGQQRSAPARSLRKLLLRRARISPCSFLLSFGWFGWLWFFRFRFHGCHRAIVITKCFVGDAANIGLGDFVDLINLAEELAPVTIERLILTELERQALIIAQAANQVSLGA